MTAGCAGSPPTSASTSMPPATGYRRTSVLIFMSSPMARYSRSEEHTSELQSLMRISYAVFCLKKKTNNKKINKRVSYTQNIYTNNKVNISRTATYHYRTQHTQPSRVTL